MSQQRLKDLIQSASARGILSPDAMPEPVARPWPIVLMTGLGAWLSALPLVVVMFMIFGDALTKGPLIYFLGAILIAAAVVVLRRGDTSEFVEQLGLPALLVGGALLAFGLERDTPPMLAGALMTLIIFAVTFMVPHNWIRVLLGAFGCATFIMTVAAYDGYRHMAAIWAGVHLALIVWLASAILPDTKHAVGIAPRAMIALESASTGWAALALLALALSSGRTFLVGASLEHLGGSDIGSALFDYPFKKALSLAMSIAGAAWLAYRWPALRAPRILLVAAMLAVLSWLIPTLGGALLMLAVCVTSGRWRLAVASASAAAWIIGSFYYQLTLPLATKAVIMTGMGAAFGVLAWMNWRSHQSAAPTASETEAGSRWRQAGIAVSLAATLIVANGAIWQKEELISTGRPVFIALAPVDPRSMMQGDYMALNFHMPALERADFAAAPRLKVIAKIDGRGVAVMRGVDMGKSLAQDEILIELLHTGGGLRPASNAWYFKEGEAERWAKAKFGEFRIDGSGRALLVDLRGANLEKL